MMASVTELPVRFELFLSHAEVAALQDLAAHAGLAPNDYVRALIAWALHEVGSIALRDIEDPNGPLGLSLEGSKIRAAVMSGPVTIADADRFDHVLERPKARRTAPLTLGELRLPETCWEKTRVRGGRVLKKTKKPKPDKPAKVMPIRKGGP